MPTSNESTRVFNSYSEFMQREDKSINGVSPSFAKRFPDYVKMNATNVGCWNCVNCEYCENCEDCWICVNCVNCKHCVNCKDCNYCWDCEVLD